MVMVTEGQRRGQLLAVADTAGADVGDGKVSSGDGLEDEVPHVLLAGVATALEAVHRDGVAAEPLRGDGVAHGHTCAHGHELGERTLGSAREQGRDAAPRRKGEGRTLVDDLDAGLVERRDERLGRAARRLHDGHALLDDDGEDGRGVGRHEGRQQGDVDAEGEGGVVEQLLALADLGAQVLRRRLRQLRRAEREGVSGRRRAEPRAEAEPRASADGRSRLAYCGDDAEAAGVRDRSRHLGVADVVHAALDDRVLDAEQLGDARLENHPDAEEAEAQSHAPVSAVERSSGGGPLAGWWQG